MFNHFEVLFSNKYPDMFKYIKSIHLDFRMSGTGSCFYLLSQNEEELLILARKIDKSLDKWVVRTLNLAY